jgi:uncharacterized protein
MLALDHDETDAGPRKSAGTDRMCLVTRAVTPVDDMLRLVVAPDGQVVVDLKRRLPGRGVWITAQRGVLTQAVKRKIFARGFKRDVKVPADLAARVEQRLERFALDALSIAYKAGRIVTGFVKVETAAASGDAIALIHAADAAADGVRKLVQATAKTEEIPQIRAFTSAQLDLALGRPNVIHAAVLGGPASQSFLARCMILVRFRIDAPGGEALASQAVETN